ncbi:plasmid replication/partition related protein [Streptomyces cavourensis]|uniref:plasmid replication/partition related protein n=1 Tax=Streptomyces cavourensis TaxID=67258 RepID=UPI001C955A7E|nr:plasmid replication/partition related protein [Streptomyces cavourensis]
MAAIRQPHTSTTAADDKEPALKIHPAADLFPMLDQDELLDLAESIRTEGQHEPIVLDSDGVLLDDRNRLAACEIAGVEPRFTTYTGADHMRLIMSGNLFRRHISKGQQAMITAMACSVSEHSLRDQAKHHGLSLTRLSNAATVLKHAPHLAEQVRVGTLGLDAAYNAAREQRDRTAALKAQYDRLREHAPDLAAQVTEGLITFDDATAALDERLETERHRQYVIDADTLRLADGDTTPPLAELVERGDITWGRAHQRAEEFLAHRQDAIDRAQHSLQLIAENWTAVQDLAARPGTQLTRDILGGLAPEVRFLAQRLITLD